MRAVERLPVGSIGVGAESQNERAGAGRVGQLDDEHARSGRIGGRDVAWRDIFLALLSKV
ncbi:MAG TPA: hypothetical protein VH539_07990 [Gemmatimonadaceae bacterium]